MLKNTVLFCALMVVSITAKSQDGSEEKKKKLDFYVHLGFGGYFNRNFDLSKHHYGATDMKYSLNEMSDQRLNSLYGHKTWPLTYGTGIIKNKINMGLSMGFGTGKEKHHLFFTDAYFHYNFYTSKNFRIHAGAMLRYENYSFEDKTYIRSTGSNRFYNLDVSLAYQKVHLNPIICFSLGNKNRYFYTELKIPVGDVFYSAFKLNYKYQYLKEYFPEVIGTVEDYRNKSIVSNGMVFVPYVMLTFHLNLKIFSA